MSWCRGLQILAVTTALGAPGTLLAQSQTYERPAVGVQFGFNEDYRRLTVNLETSPWWSRDTSWGRFSVLGEFGLSYWHARHRTQDGAASAWQASATPLLRWWWTERFFVEAGVGVTLFNHTHLGDRQLSTAMQFGDHLGLGYQLTPQWRVTLRASHFSNAGIKRPNRGLDAYQLGLTYQW